MREFFIRREIEGTFNFDRYATELRQLGSRISGRSASRRPGIHEAIRLQDESEGHAKTEELDPRAPDMHAWQGRAEDEEQLRRWLEEPPDTFIVVDGPPGSGKTEMVNQVLEEHSMYLTIDCDALLSARNDEEIIELQARQVG
jgi:hypothetical protein